MPVLPTRPDAPREPATTGDPPPADPRTAHHATRELAGMFDQVSPRYDLLNRVMSLGRDTVWRRAMWRAVPEEAHAVLDLCTGSGSSLGGLRRPGRLVLGMDVSLGMLEFAAERHGRAGWAPRLACADAFRLPLRDRSLDGVTIAFGARNLRPRVQALSEIARALKPGGRLIVLEATSPRPGFLAPFHLFYIRHVIPLAGRLSPDPSAYVYLSRSIVEFGAGPEFEADLAAAGFDVISRRSFMMGATGLWVAERREAVPTGGSPQLQRARLGELARGEMPNRGGRAVSEWRWWNGIQLGLSAALFASLVYALWVFLKLRDRLSLEPWQRSGMRVLLGAGIVAFAVRTVFLWLRITAPPPRE